MREHRDLRAAVFAALLCAIGALLLPVDVLRLIFAAPLLLFLPGYALASAVLLERQLQRAQLFALSIGLSLSVLALGGLALNYLDGLRSWTWALLLVLVVIGASRLAAIRRPKASTEAWKLPVGVRPGAFGLAAIVVGALAFSAAITLAFVPVSAKHAVGYTALWAAPSPSGYFAVGVANEEHNPQSYGLIARFGPKRELDVRRFTLKPGEKRTFKMSPPVAPRRALRALATLYRTGYPNEPYRQVTGWISPPSPDD